MIRQNEIEKLVELKEMASEYKRLYSEMKARIEAGENAEAGGWRLNSSIVVKQIVAWKRICVREKGQAWCDNVQHNTRKTAMLILKPAFSIAGEKSARKTA